MAKNNLLLGSAAGSVGDVTLMRRQGVQVSRVRVRSIANPKTFGQAQQRCYMAPIPKFYAPLAIALEKSWEGKSKSESYSAFLKKNAQLARDNNWTLPKGTAFFPMPYRVSNGTLPSVNAYVDDQGGQIMVDTEILSSDIVTFGDFSQTLVSSLGLQNGDQLTFITILKANEGVFIPTYARIYLNVTSNESVNVALGHIGYSVPSSVAGDDNIIIVPVNTLNGIMGCAIIASRWENDMWRRSIESLNVAPEILAAIAGPDVAAANIATYMNSATANPSDVYLNGSPE